MGAAQLKFLARRSRLGPEGAWGAALCAAPRPKYRQPGFACNGPRCATGLATGPTEIAEG
jgi:hypothetical protein